MRKGLMALAAVLLLWTVFPSVAAQAAVEAKIEVATVDGSVGDQVEIPITISDCEGVDSLQFRINYDASSLKFARLYNGDVFESEFLASNPSEAGLVRVATIAAYGLTTSGTVLTLKMQVLSETGSAVTISDAVATSVDPENDFLQSKAYLSVTDGGVTVGGGSLPAAKTTPWIAETPEPTATPEPEPTPEPTFSPVPTEAPAEETPEITDAADESQQPSSMAALLAAAGAALIVLTVAILLIGRGQKR